MMVVHEEEALALLDEFELGDQDLNAQSKFPINSERRVWRFKCSRASCLAILLIAASLFLAGVTVLFLVKAQQDGSPVHEATSSIGLALHPQDHVSRSPGALEFNWTITAGFRSPDGVQKRVYLVNGEFPGPTIESRSGDRIIVHVHNHLQDEGVSLHWHGLNLMFQNVQDGAVGFTQCHIPSGRSHTYNFTIGDDEIGTYWWHSHSDVQRADGLWGGLVVHSPTPDTNSVEETLVMIGDWFHRNHTEVLGWYADSRSMGNEPVPDSLLINGHGRFECAMAVPARPVNCSEIASSELKPLVSHLSSRAMRLRVVNTGSISGVSIGISNAVMKPVSIDGGFRVQSDATAVVGILYPGERVDIDVKWEEGQSGPSWFTVQLDDENFGYPNPALNPTQSFPMLPGQAELGPLDSLGPPRNLMTDQLPVLDPQRLKAAARVTEIPGDAEETLLLYAKTELLAHLDYQPIGSINHTSWKPQAPPLLGQNSSLWDANQLVPFIRISEGRPTRVTVVINNLDDGAHPFHLHGHQFYLLSSYREESRGGWGSYNPYSGEDPPNGLDLDFPLRKDTVVVPRRGHVVLALLADNPGIWALHCHMLVHMARGMVMALHIAEDTTGVPNTQAVDLCST